jgi:hypothetical protein
MAGVGLWGLSSVIELLIALQNCKAEVGGREFGLKKKLTNVFVF